MHNFAMRHILLYFAYFCNKKCFKNINKRAHAGSRRSKTCLELRTYQDPITTLHESRHTTTPPADPAPSFDTPEQPAMVYGDAKPKLKSKSIREVLVKGSSKVAAARHLPDLKLHAHLTHRSCTGFQQPSWKVSQTQNSERPP